MAYKENRKVMKVVIVNTKQKSGGAAIASFSLFKALQREGVDATFVTTEEGENGKGVVVLTKSLFGRIKYKMKFLWERVIIWIANRFSRKGLFAVSTADCGFDISRLPEVQNADIIHLHWINQGMLSIKGMAQLIASGKPIVISTHDMWYSTAICHHAATCKKQSNGCKDCPQLAGNSRFDLAQKVWEQKKELYKENVTFVAISKWTDDCLNRSALTANCRRIIIPNAVDDTLFFERNRMEIRKRLDIKPEETVIVFGAAKLNDKIKGADMLFEAISRSNIKERLVLILFGNIKDNDDFLQRVPCRYIHLGSISDKEKQAEIYSAADFTVVPSHYETFSLVVAESMLCGTPAIAFDNSATAEHIRHKRNGYIAHYPDIDDLKDGIEWMADNHSGMRMECAETMRGKVSPQHVVQQHIELYRSLLTE